MTTFAERVIDFYGDLSFSGSLPEGISVMNPVKENEIVSATASEFYRKYYSDNRKRHLILGINPGRFGAGTTGIPFTDTVRLKEKCGLDLPGIKTYEPSSVFIYEVIDRYGGPEKFYGDYFITSVSPLGFTRTGTKGKDLNYNYYDNRELTESVYDFMLESLEKQLKFGIDRKRVICLGTGKNFSFLTKLNSEHHLFDRISALEHPRFIMQYKLRMKQSYIQAYIDCLSRC